MILALPERSAPDLVKLIAVAQKPDGSWPLSVQPSDMQYSSNGPADAARLFSLALATPGNTPPEAEAARAKVATVLGKKDPPKSLNSLVYRTLYA